MEEVLFSPGLVMLPLNVAAATIVVGLVAVIVGRSRRVTLPLQHGLLCIAMFLILASPLPIWIATRFHLGLLPIVLPSVVVSAERDHFPVEPMKVRPWNGPTHLESQLPSTNDGAQSDSAEELGASVADAAAIDNPPPNDFSASSADNGWIPAVLSICGRLFLLVWGTVGIGFAGRLIYGLFVVRRLRRSLRPSTDARLIAAARQVFAAAGVKSIARIAESSLAPAPLTLGWVRPVIVVPGGLADALNDAQLSSMLAHEAAHVRRRDTLIAILQQLASAAFWWNPFVHSVNRRINRLREQLCDDFAALQPGHGVALAQALVRVAEWSAARAAPSPLTNGLLEDGSDLEERIRRLTDDDRTISNRLNGKSFAVLGGFGLVLGALLLLPILRADEGELPEDWFELADLPVNVRPEPAVERIAGERNVHLSEPAPISLSGYVRTLDKKPVSGAKVYLLSHHGSNEFHEADEPLAVTHTDAEGRYQFQNVELPTITTGRSNAVFEPFGTFQVCAESDGFGIAWHGSRHYHLTPRPTEFPRHDQDSGYHQGEAIEMDLTLRPARSLTGRILDDRGRPVENATIEVRNLDYLDTEGHEHHVNSREFCVLYLTPARLFQAQTGADGCFEIQGLPDESVARVMIEHPDFAQQSLLAAITKTPITENRYIVTATHTFSEEGDKPVSYPNWETRSVRTSPLEIRLRGTRRVLIDVVHENDGSPARGVNVSAATAIIGANSEALSSGKTDEQGRAALQLPPGKYQLYLLPIRTSDDLLTTREVTVDEQPGEQTFQVPLKKGCTLTLEVVDAVTGQGIKGVSFMKATDDGGSRHSGFSTNRHTGFSTDENGECRTIVTPGIQHYGIEIADGYPNIDPFGQKKAVDCQAGKTARLQFRLRK